jgi:hypothetical protein
VAPRAARFGGARATGELADRADEAAHLHGLREVLLEAAIERRRLVLRARERGERDRRQIPLAHFEPLPHGVDEVVAGRARHSDVAHEEMEPAAVAAQHVDGFLRGADAHDLRTLLGE